MGFRNVDRLSNMPDEILSEILSLMPTKYAVRTSILSKRWRYYWTLVTNIDINVLPFHGLERSCTFVDRVLDLCKTTEIKLFRLHFSDLRVQKSRITKWIDEAVRLMVKELYIQSALLELPLSLFTCKTLLKLSISTRNAEWHTPSNLPCVKALDIFVYHSSSYLSAFKLIRGCPVLESLSFGIVYGGDKDYVFNIPTLKHLKLNMEKSDLINRVVLNAPNLEDLCITGRWCPLFVMEDLSSIVSVILSLRIKLEPSHLWGELIKGIVGAKSLSLHMPKCNLPGAPLLNLPNIKHLELMSGYKFERLRIFQFLESFSELEHISIMTEELYGLYKQESCWFKPHLVPTCMLKSLRTIKYEIFNGRMDDILFLEYMLGHAEVLKKLTITWNSENVKDEKSLCANLLKCPRISRYCEIHFVEKSFISTANF